jgi:hypothetical protein
MLVKIFKCFKNDRGVNSAMLYCKNFCKSHIVPQYNNNKNKFKKCFKCITIYVYLGTWKGKCLPKLLPCKLSFLMFVLTFFISSEGWNFTDLNRNIFHWISNFVIFKGFLLYMCVCMCVYKYICTFVAFYYFYQN